MDIFDWPVLLVILVVVLLIFGPGKLPQIGEALGKTLHNFKKATGDVRDAVDLTPQAKQLPPNPPGPGALPPEQVTQAQPAPSAPTAQPSSSGPGQKA